MYYEVCTSPKVFELVESMLTCRDSLQPAIRTIQGMLRRCLSRIANGQKSKRKPKKFTAQATKRAGAHVPE